MKNAIKTVTFLLVIAGASLTSKAQTQGQAHSSGPIYSIGAESGIAVGDFKNAYNWNLGGSIQADIPIIDQLFITINAGYQNYFAKSNVYGTNYTSADIHTIPAKAGLKYFPVNNFYIQGEAGAAFALNKSDVGFSNGTAFIWAPGIGVQIPLNKTNFIDAGVKYEASTNFTSGIDNSKLNFLGLRISYAFSVK